MYATCKLCIRYMYNSAYVRRSLCIKERKGYAGHTLLYADTSISYVTLGISYSSVRHMFYVWCAYALHASSGFLIRLQRMPAYKIYFSYVGIRWLKRYSVTGP